MIIYNKNPGLEKIAIPRGKMGENWSNEYYERVLSFLWSRMWFWQILSKIRRLEQEFSKWGIFPLRGVNWGKSKIWVYFLYISIINNIYTKFHANRTGNKQVRGGGHMAPPPPGMRCLKHPPGIGLIMTFSRVHYHYY